MHLDIETDDVPAEVARLVALGAEQVEEVQTWQVMRDPSGQLFCVVRPQKADFPAGGTRWSEPIRSGQAGRQRTHVEA